MSGDMDIPALVRQGVIAAVVETLDLYTDPDLDDADSRKLGELIADSAAAKVSELLGQTPVSRAEVDQLRSALQLVLDQVDYIAGSCRPNELIGGVLPPGVIVAARDALAHTRRIRPGDRLAVFDRFVVLAKPGDAVVGIARSHELSDGEVFVEVDDSKPGQWRRSGYEARSRR